MGAVADVVDVLRQVGAVDGGPDVEVGMVAVDAAIDHGHVGVNAIVNAVDPCGGVRLRVDPIDAGGQFGRVCVLESRGAGQ